MSNLPTYVIHDGYVKSTYDGEHHYISHVRVMELYGVHKLPSNRVSFYPSRKDQFFGWQEPENAVHLRPRNDGRYVLMEASEK